MKINKKILNLNDKFKESLDENNESKWESICKYATITSIMSLFVSWICKNEWYKYSLNYISWSIIDEIKSEKNISFMDKKYYFWIRKLFDEFVNFYMNNLDFREDVKIYLYEYKKNLIQSKNNKKLNDLINFIEKNDSENSKKHRENLKYIFNFLSEQDILFIFDQFQKQSEELYRLNQKNEKDPFHKVKWIMNNEIRERKINENFIWKINSLFGVYLNFLKIKNNLWENLWENNSKSKNVQRQINLALAENCTNDENWTWVTVFYEDWVRYEQTEYYSSNGWEITTPDWTMIEIDNVEKYVNNKKNKKTSKKNNWQLIIPF